MISAKQLAANQANAHWSTGPRTPEGKAKTRLNAVKHALTGQLTVVAPSDHATFTSLSGRLTADLKPSGEQELQIAARIVRDTWRLHRAAAHEDNIYAIGLIGNGNREFLTDGPANEESSHAEADPDHALAPDPAHIAFTNARTFFSKLHDFNLAGLYEQRIHRSLIKDYALFRQLQQDRKKLEAQEISRPRAVATAKAAAANGSDFSGIFEVPSARPQLPKTEPQTVNFTSPYLPPSENISQETQNIA